MSLPALATRGGGLPWRLLRVLVYNLPSGAQTFRALDISNAWTDETHMIAHVVEALAVANWQRSKDGTKGHNKPKPIRRPGQAAAPGVTRYGVKKSRHSHAKVRALLAARGPQLEEEVTSDG